MLTPLFPPDYAGGSEQAFTLCKGLKKRGVKVFVITGCIGKYRQIMSEEVDGIETHRVYRKRGDNFFEITLYAMRILYLLFKYRGDYDLIHIHGIRYYPFIALIPAKIFRKKIIAKMTLVGSDDPISIEKRKLGLLQLKLISSLDRIISISAELTEIYKSSRLPNEKLVEIPNGVDTKKFSPISSLHKDSMRRMLGLPQEKVIVTFVGIIDKRKGVDLLVSAWGTISKKCEKCHLLLIGPKTIDENEIVDENFVSNIEGELMSYSHDNFRLMGHIPNVREYLQVSDIFVLPSRREGLPNTLLEAMSCGLPCVTTRALWANGVIEESTSGFLVDVGDIQSLAQVVIKLIRDYDSRVKVGKTARKKITKNFSIEQVLDRYIRLYEEVIMSDDTTFFV